MVTLWLHYGYTVATLRLHCGYIMVTLWLHYGYTVATLRLHCGYITVTLWLHCGYTVATLYMVTLWPYNIYTMVTYFVDLVKLTWSSSCSHFLDSSYLLLRDCCSSFSLTLTSSLASSLSLTYWIKVGLVCVPSSVPGSVISRFWAMAYKEILFFQLQF